MKQRVLSPASHFQLNGTPLRPAAATGQSTQAGSGCGVLRTPSSLPLSFATSSDGSVLGNTAENIYYQGKTPNASLADNALAVEAQSSNTGGSQSVSKMQPYTTVHFIIALQGLYPPVLTTAAPSPGPVDSESTRTTMSNLHDREHYEGKDGATLTVKVDENTTVELTHVDYNDASDEHIDGFSVVFEGASRSSTRNSTPSSTPTPARASCFSSRSSARTPRSGNTNSSCRS